MITGFARDPNLTKAGYYAERDKWTLWNVAAGVSCVALATSTGFLAVWPADVLFMQGGETGQKMADIGQYYHSTFSAMFSHPARHAYFENYWHPWFKSVFLGNADVPMTWLGWGAFNVVGAITAFVLNPYRRIPGIHGQTRWAGVSDIKKMSKDDVCGFDGKLFICGKLNGRMIRMKESLSVLLLAPPGTGKTTGFIAPSAVTLNNSSLFIHDCKPELWTMCSGSREVIGPCFQLSWAAQDAPEGKWVSPKQAKQLPDNLLKRDEAGSYIKNNNGEYFTLPIFYPSWNVLSPQSIPPIGNQRDLYIDRFGQVLAPDPSAGEKFWYQSARNAIIGFAHYVVIKMEAARDPLIKGNLQGIPEEYWEQEASMPLLVDWFTRAQIDFDDETAEDPMKQMMRSALDDARKIDDAYAQHYGRRPLTRAISEFVKLANMPDKTRQSVIATLEQAIAPFRLESVRERTKRSDFSFADLRGIPKKFAKDRELAKVAAAKERGETYLPRYAPDASEWDPVTLCVSVDVGDAKSYAAITGILADSLNAYLQANGPNAIDDQGRQVGPFDFTFLFDEAPVLPKLDAIAAGPSTGRSKRLSYIIVAQDDAQLELKYSKQEVNILYSNAAIKIILSQNSYDTAKRISDLLGQITYTQHNYSERQNKWEAFFGSKSKSESLAGTAFVKPTDIMAIPKGQNIIIAQYSGDRPVKSQTPLYFLDKEMRKLIYDEKRGTGPRPAPPMPLPMMATALADYRRSKQVKTEYEAQKAAKSDPRHVLILTPTDIASIRSGGLGIDVQPGNVWAYAAVDIRPDTNHLAAEMQSDEIHITNDPIEVAEFVGQSWYITFNDDTLAKDMNDHLQAAGQPILKPSMFVSLQARMRAVLEEHQATNLFESGYGTGPSMHPPNDESLLDEIYCMNYFAEVMSWVLSVEESVRLFLENSKKAA